MGLGSVFVVVTHAQLGKVCMGVNYSQQSKAAAPEAHIFLGELPTYKAPEKYGWNVIWSKMQSFSPLPEMNSLYLLCFVITNVHTVEQGSHRH